MTNLSVAFFLISIVLFTVGLINPKWVPLFTKEQKTRKRSATLYGLAIVVFFILIAITAPKTPPVTKNTPVVSPTIEIKKTDLAKPSNNPTPTSTDPCHEYQGTDQWQSCNKLNYALKHGQEPALNATVRFGSTYLSITNNDNIEWDACNAYIPNETDPNAYVNDTGIVVSPHQTGTIAWSDLTLNDGTRFDYYSTKPESVEIDCSVGANHDSHHSLFYPQ